MSSPSHDDELPGPRGNRGWKGCYESVHCKPPPGPGGKHYGTSDSDGNGGEKAEGTNGRGQEFEEKAGAYQPSTDTKDSNILDWEPTIFNGLDGKRFEERYQVGSLIDVVDSEQLIPLSDLRIQYTRSEVAEGNIGWFNDGDPYVIKQLDEVAQLPFPPSARALLQQGMAGAFRRLASVLTPDVAIDGSFEYLIQRQALWVPFELNVYETEPGQHYTGASYVETIDTGRINLGNEVGAYRYLVFGRRWTGGTRSRFVSPYEE